MTFAELKAELIARGFDSLTDARAGVLINAARGDLDRAFLWPWREASATGVSPLVISDLGTIEKVLNTTSGSTAPLTKVDYSLLVDLYGDLSTSGTPLYYYVAWPNGVPEVATYPSNSDVIGVQYWKTTPDLVNGSDTPAPPSECHYTIVDIAVRRAYRDKHDHEAAVALQPEIDNAISQFLASYGSGVADGPDGYVPVDLSSAVDW